MNWNFYCFYSFLLRQTKKSCNDKSYMFELIKPINSSIN